LAQEVLEVVAGQDRGARFAMAGEELVVGREPTMDAVLTDPLVSGRHARLALHEGRLLAEDLGSSAGTSLNGAPLSGPASVSAGDRLVMGQTELLVLWSPAPATAADGPTGATARLGPPPPPPPPPGAAEGVPVSAAPTIERRDWPALTAGGLAVLAGILTIVAIGPNLLDGESIGGSEDGGLIAQTVLEGLAAGALGARVGLGVLGRLPRMPAVDALLPGGMLLIGGIVLGQGLVAASISNVGKGPAVTLLLLAGLLALAAGAIAVAARSEAAPAATPGQAEAAMVGVAAFGALLAAIGAPLAWYAADFAGTLSGTEAGPGHVLLPIAIVTIPVALGPLAPPIPGLEHLGATTARLALVLGSVLFGMGLTACTIVSGPSLESGVVLCLLGGILAAAGPALAWCRLVLGAQPRQ
jgi:hypothetical protein